MSKDLKRRVAALGEADDGLRIGGLLDLLSRWEAGEDVDLSRVRIGSKLAAALDELPPT